MEPQAGDGGTVVTMTAAQLRSILIKPIVQKAVVYVRLPDGQFAEVVGYSSENGKLILELVIDGESEKG